MRSPCKRIDRHKETHELAQIFPAARVQKVEAWDPCVTEISHVIYGNVVHDSLGSDCFDTVLADGRVCWMDRWMCGLAAGWLVCSDGGRRLSRFVEVQGTDGGHNVQPTKARQTFKSSTNRRPTLLLSHHSRVDPLTSLTSQPLANVSAPGPAQA